MASHATCSILKECNIVFGLCLSLPCSFVTSTWDGPGGSDNGTFQNPPLLFHLENDPSEKYSVTFQLQGFPFCHLVSFSICAASYFFQIDPNSTEYMLAATVIEVAMLAHQETLTPVPNEMVRQRLCAGDFLAAVRCQ